jgi:hypothetical protein
MRPSGLHFSGSGEAEAEGMKAPILVGLWLRTKIGFPDSVAPGSLLLACKSRGLDDRCGSVVVRGVAGVLTMVVIM